MAQTMSSLMFVATGSLILPAAFEAGLPHDKSTRVEILALSRGTSIVLLVLYLLYLFFQLKTHYFLFETVPSEERTNEDTEPAISPLTCAFTMGVAAVTIAICSDYLVGSIDSVVASWGISKTFIGLILLPVVGNAGIPVVTITLISQHSPLRQFR